MQIEVFADVWCPFTHVGLRRFVDLRAEMGTPPTLVVRSWPLSTSTSTLRCATGTTAGRAA